MPPSPPGPAAHRISALATQKELGWNDRRVQERPPSRVCRNSPDEIPHPRSTSTNERAMNTRSFTRTQVEPPSLVARRPSPETTHPRCGSRKSTASTEFELVSTGCQLSPPSDDDMSFPFTTAHPRSSSTNWSGPEEKGAAWVVGGTIGEGDSLGAGVGRTDPLGVGVWAGWPSSVGRKA